MKHDLTLQAPVEKIYTSIADLIRGMKSAGDVPLFNLVDNWNKQPERTGPEDVFPMPAAFVHVQGIKWERIDEEESLATVTFTVYVCTDRERDDDFTADRLLNAVCRELCDAPGGPMWGGRLLCSGRPERTETLTGCGLPALVYPSDTYMMYTLGELLEG